MTATVHVPRDSGLSRLILSLGRRFIPPQIAGRIEIHLPSGRCLELGDRRMGATAELHLRNWNPLWRSMRRCPCQRTTAEGTSLPMAKPRRAG